MHARQNTVEAFALAIEHGADGVELDVRRTRDGAMVVHHEERAIPGAAPFITQDLKAIKAATPWVPTLDEAWTAIGDSALMNIEIKNKVGQADFDQGRRIAAQVVEWVQANAALERVLVSSFDGISLKAVRDRDPDIHTGILATIAVDPTTAIEWAKRDGHFSVNLPLPTVLGDALRIVEVARPVQVLVWTVNDPHAALTLADAGIGGLFSDDPGLIVAALAQR
ncbi:MAG: glycerophosphodiester phosphodiesterase [Acidimicrobiia bacterium]|nr:MAG: glycerophosphodiester phosphodiesterase [Acidimicrobiia bacterium]